MKFALPIVLFSIPAMVAAGAEGLSVESEMQLGGRLYDARITSELKRLSVIEAQMLDLGVDREGMQYLTTSVCEDPFAVIREKLPPLIGEDVSFDVEYPVDEGVIGGRSEVTVDHLVVSGGISESGCLVVSSVDARDVVSQTSAVNNAALQVSKLGFKAGEDQIDISLSGFSAKTSKGELIAKLGAADLGFSGDVYRAVRHGQSLDILSSGRVAVDFEDLWIDVGVLLGDDKREVYNLAQYITGFGSGSYTSADQHISASLSGDVEGLASGELNAEFDVSDGVSFFPLPGVNEVLLNIVTKLKLSRASLAFNDQGAISAIEGVTGKTAEAHTERFEGRAKKLLGDTGTSAISWTNEALNKGNMHISMRPDRAAGLSDFVAAIFSGGDSLSKMLSLKAEIK